MHVQRVLNARRVLKGVVGLVILLAVLLVVSQYAIPPSIPFTMSATRPTTATTLSTGVTPYETPQVIFTSSEPMLCMRYAACYNEAKALWPSEDGWKEHSCVLGVSDPTLPDMAAYRLKEQESVPIEK